jgi:hypothetical protein
MDISGAPRAFRWLQVSGLLRRTHPCVFILCDRFSLSWMSQSATSHATGEAVTSRYSSTRVSRGDFLALAFGSGCQRLMFMSRLPLGATAHYMYMFLCWLAPCWRQPTMVPTGLSVGVP